MVRAEIVNTIDADWQVRLFKNARELEIQREADVGDGSVNPVIISPRAGKMLQYSSSDLDNIKKKGHHRFCWEPGQSSSVGPNPQEPNEIDVLKQENGVLKQENSVLKQENGVLKQENGVLKPGGGLLVVRQGRLLGKDLDRMNSEQLHALQRQLHESLMCVKKREEQISMENLKQCRIQKQQMMQENEILREKIEELERRFASTSTPEITCDAGPADKDLDANTFLGIQKMLARDLEPGQRSAVGPNPQMQEPNEIGVLKQEKGVLKQEIGDLNLGIRKLISYHCQSLGTFLDRLNLEQLHSFQRQLHEWLTKRKEQTSMESLTESRIRELLKQQQNEIVCRKIEEFRQGLPSTSTPEADKDSDANPLLGIKKMLARELEFGQSSAVGSNPQEPNEVGVLKREIGVLKQEIGGLNSGIRKLIWYHCQLLGRYIDRLNLEQLLAFQKQVHESLMKRKEQRSTESLTESRIRELLKKQQNEIFRRKIEELTRCLPSTSTPGTTRSAGPANKDSDANPLLGIKKMLARDLDPGQRSAVGPNPQEPNEIGILKQENDILKLGIQKLIWSQCQMFGIILNRENLQQLHSLQRQVHDMLTKTKGQISTESWTLSRIWELLLMQQNHILWEKIEERQRRLPSASTPGTTRSAGPADQGSDANPLLGPQSQKRKTSDTNKNTPGNENHSKRRMMWNT